MFYGLYMHYLVASERGGCRKSAEDPVELADRLGDVSLQVVAATAKGGNLLQEGRFAEAGSWLERARGLYDPERTRHQGADFGLDGRAWATAILAWVEWGTGRTARSLQLAQEAVDWAREIHHVPSLAVALLYLGQIHQMGGDKPAALRFIGELLGLAKTYGLPAFEGYGAAVAAWAADDLRSVAAIIDVLRSLGCYLSLPYYGLYLADIEAAAGHLDEAIAHVEQSLALCAKLEERFFEARAPETASALRASPSAAEHRGRALVARPGSSPRPGPGRCPLGGRGHPRHPAHVRKRLGRGSRWTVEGDLLPIPRSRRKG